MAHLKKNPITDHKAIYFQRQVIVCSRFKFYIASFNVFGIYYVLISVDQITLLIW